MRGRLLQVVCQVLVLILLDLAVVGSDAVVLGPSAVEDVRAVAMLLVLECRLVDVDCPKERTAHLLVAVVNAPRAKVILLGLHAFQRGVLELVLGRASSACHAQS